MVQNHFELYGVRGLFWSPVMRPNEMDTMVAALLRKRSYQSQLTVTERRPVMNGTSGMKHLQIGGSRNRGVGK